MGKRIHITSYLIILLGRSLFLPIKVALPSLLPSFPGNLRILSVVSRNVANTLRLPISAPQQNKSWAVSRTVTINCSSSMVSCQEGGQIIEVLLIDWLIDWLIAVLGLRFCVRAFYLRQVGATLHCGARASHYRGLSCCGAQAPDAQAQQLWLTGLVAPRHVGSSQTRARTHVPCIDRQSLNHCATRGAQRFLFIGLAKKFVWFFPYLTEKPKQTFWPTQYLIP